MEKGRNTMLFSGRSPRALLPLSMITLSLAIAAVLCCAGCSSFESVSPDIPTAPSLCKKEGNGRDIFDMSFTPDLRVCLPSSDGKSLNISTRADAWRLIRRLDLFVFDPDGIRALDSYTRSYAYSPYSVSVPSASGDKLVVAVANRDFPDEEVTAIHCYEDLKAAVVELTGDHPSWPVMSGETRFVAGKGHSCSITLEPMMSTVEIHSLRCRMEGPYTGQSLRRVKVYLTGISNRAELLRGSGFLPAETLNNGGLSETDLKRLAYSGMVYRYLGDGRDSDGETEYGTAALYCYPNESGEESPGSPFTKLVIEGELDGKTRYYTIPVNRGSDDGQTGIGRNRRYVFDLTIRGPGTESPDDIALFQP